MSSVARAFVRKSSGLVRSFSIIDVIIINVACVAMGWTVMVVGFLAASLWPGANIALSMLFGAVPAVFMGLVYGLFSAAMPRSGGDYVFISRILHPALGFTINWGITWSLFLGVAMYAATLISWTVVPTFATLGLATGNSDLVSLSEAINTPGWTFLIGVVAIAVITAVMLLGTRFLRNAFRLLLAIAMLGLVLTVVLLFTTSQSQFAESFNAFLASYNNNPDTYGMILKQAGDAGWTPVAFGLGATVLALPLGYWMYLGTTYSAYVSGEVKEPSKSQPFGILIAMLVALIFTAGIVQLAYGTFGWDFVQAIGFLQGSGSEIPLPAAAMLPFFLGTINSNPVIIAFVGLTYFVWAFMLVMTLMFFPVRNIFAWAFDRLLPEGITRTNRGGTPWVATLVIAAASLLMLYFYVYTGYLTMMVNYMTLVLIVFFFTSIAAVVFPYTKKQLFESAPRVVQTKIGGVPLITIAGIVTLVIYSFMLYISFTLPAFSGPTGWQSYTFLIGLFVVGAIYYTAMRAYRKHQGIDVDLNWQEIPPE